MNVATPLPGIPSVKHGKRAQWSAGIALLLLCGAGCSSHNVRFERTVQEALPLAARAMDLRQERLVLSERISSIQDTIRALGTDTARARQFSDTLQALALRRDSILTVSIDITDSLRYRLRRERFNEEEREQFNTQLNDALRKRGYVIEESGTKSKP